MLGRMHVPEEQTFEFGDFILSPKERLLLPHGEPISLTGKAFDILVVLVRNAGRLVSKDELLSAVWPGRIVQEVSLSVNIAALRKVIQRGKSDKAIQTIPAHGYRFIEPVTTKTGSAIHLLAQVSDNPDAYRAYLQGRHELNQRSEKALKRAADAFGLAISIDSRFVPAYSGLADCYATLGSLSHLSPTETFPRARQYALKALQLNASLAEPHASLGFVKLYFDWDWPGAEAEFQRAVSVDPGYAAAHQWYSIYLLAMRRFADAAREIQSAQKREPLSLPVNSDLGFHYYYTRQYDEAVKQLKFVLKLNKDFAPAHLWLGRAYQELGRFDDAIAEFELVESVLDEWPVVIAARGSAAAAAGRTDAAHRALTELESLARKKFVTAYGVGLIYAGLDENDAAFAQLDKAFDERSHWLVWLGLDPRWKRLRDDPRFVRLEDRLNLPRTSDVPERAAS